MKKFRFIFLFLLILGIFCSCSKAENNNDSSQSKEVKDYKTFSCKDYSLKYDDKLFTHVSEDDCELFIYNNKDEIFTGLKIEKIENTTVEKTIVEVEKEYEQKNYFDVSSDSSQIISVPSSKCVTAFADDGERIYETHVVAFSNGVYTLEYNFSTSLDQIVVENALYATVSSFKLK